MMKFNYRGLTTMFLAAFVDFLLFFLAFIASATVLGVEATPLQLVGIAIILVVLVFGIVSIFMGFRFKKGNIYERG